MLQTLENRRLLSAAIQFEPVSGVLYVIGSDKADQIEVGLSNKPLPHINGIKSRFQLPIQEGNYVNVYDQGSLVYQGSLPGKSLQAVHIFADAGDDVILACNFGSSVPIVVGGGDGDDEIQAVHFDQTPRTEIYAGEGDDLVQVSASLGATSGFLVWGEGGDDVIYGSALNDQLYGDADETLERPPCFGNDIIYAGAGDDYLCGGAGDDALYGQAGDDLLKGCGGCDMLDGGDGFDTGIYDEFDKIFVDIEKLTQGD